MPSCVKVSLNNDLNKKKKKKVAVAKLLRN